MRSETGARNGAGVGVIIRHQHADNIDGTTLIGYANGVGQWRQTGASWAARRSFQTFSVHGFVPERPTPLMRCWRRVKHQRISSGARWRRNWIGGAGKDGGRPSPRRPRRWRCQRRWCRPRAWTGAQKLRCRRASKGDGNDSFRRFTHRPRLAWFPLASPTAEIALPHLVAFSSSRRPDSLSVPSAWR